MYACHRRINKNEQIVGWYATTAADGALVVNNTSLINEFYARECENPVHIVVDTTLAGDDMKVRGFVSQALMVEGRAFANMFREIKVSFEISEAETTCLALMIPGSRGGGNWNGGSLISSDLQKPKDQMHMGLDRLLEILDTLQEYVDGVVDGDEAPLGSVGMALSDVLTSLGSIKADDVETIFEEKKQDLLMVAHITSLMQAQLKVSEKLNSVM